MRARTVGAIALGTTGNVQGTYEFLSLDTFKAIRRNTWTPMPMPAEVISLLNKRAESDKRTIAVNASEFRHSLTDSSDRAQGEACQTDGGPIQAASGSAGEAGVSSGLDIELPLDAVGDLPPAEEMVGEISEPGESTDTATDRSGSGHQVQTTHGYNLRSVNVDNVETVLANISVDKAMRECGDEAALAMMREMAQMVNKNVFHGVRWSQLTEKQRAGAVRSHMFLKRKRDGSLKARLVVDGSMQERLGTDDTSSPTVSTDAVFITAAVEAHEGRHTMTMDIEGAYLHADMTSEVIVKLEPVVAGVLSEYCKDFSNFRMANGCIVVVLDKALYGCIESAKLFYDHLSTSLKSIGYVPNMYDICVFNKWYGEDVCTVTVHVDDLKVSSMNLLALTELEANLNRIYKKVNVNVGPIFDYLGMRFDYSNKGEVAISMQDMIEEIMSDNGITGKARTPAADYLFNSSEKAVLLEEKDRKAFHSNVQQLLYVAKRTRPDILTVVSYLTTRVKEATDEDGKKLSRLLCYLNSTSDLKLHLSSDGGNLVQAYVDASFAVHSDGKGHTGAVISIGSGAVTCKSTKQKLVAKSSTEAELIAVSDALSQVLWTRNFLEGQGYKMKPALLHQDNKSSILLINRGRPASARTRHVAIRYFFVKDRIDSKEVDVQYLGTEDMVADIFTKPLSGELFLKFRKVVLNTPNDG
jgi:hypothetical protein